MAVYELIALDETVTDVSGRLLAPTATDTGKLVGSLLVKNITITTDSITSAGGAISFGDENLSTTGSLTAGTLICAGTLTFDSSTVSFAGATISDLGTITTANIDGGTVDGTTIGGTTPAAGTFTTLNATGGGALTGTWTDLGTVTTVDINGGTIDAATIGGTTPAAGTFTALNATGGGALTGTWTNLGSVTTIDINGGTIDGTTIGAGTAAAGTFTDLTVNGNTTLGDAATDTVTVTADVASHLIPSTDDTYDLGAVGSEWRDLHVDGSANIDTLTADAATVGGATIPIHWLEFEVYLPSETVATGEGLVTFTCPFDGTILQSDTDLYQLAAVVDTAGTTGTQVVDIHLNGTSIMTTNKLDIETLETSTATATTQPDLTTTAISAGDKITIDVDAVHTTPALGLRVIMAIQRSSNG